MKLRMTIHPKTMWTVLAALCLVGAAQGQVVKTEDRQGVEEDRFKNFRSLSSKDKLVFAFRDKELLASRAELADLSDIRGFSWLSSRQGWKSL